MTLRTPRTSNLPRPARTPVDALDYEIAQEMAAALGRLGRDLERALAALAAFDAARARQPPDRQQRAARGALVAEAGHALWCLMVQREACGLRDSRQLMRDFGVPPEVRDRMGAFPADRGKRAVPHPAQTSPRRSQK